MGKRDVTPELDDEEPPILGWGTPLSKLVEDTKASARLVDPPFPLLCVLSGASSQENWRRHCPPPGGEIEKRCDQE